MKSEVDRLDILKQCHLEKFIKATRVELTKVWDQCLYGENQRMEFPQAFNGKALKCNASSILLYTSIISQWINLSLSSLPSDEFTDDSLSAHESELDKMRGFYADNNEIFKLIEKRESLWEQKIEMDVSHCRCVCHVIIMWPYRTVRMILQD